MDDRTPFKDCTRITAKAWGRDQNGERWANEASIVATRHAMREAGNAILYRVIQTAEVPLRKKGVSITHVDHHTMPCHCDDSA